MYHRGHARTEVHLPDEARPVVGRTIVEYLLRENHRVIAVAVAKVHVHALVELPDHMQRIRQIAGHAKRHSSRAVKRLLPGSIWGEGGKFKRIADHDHQRATFEYILYDQGPDAWTWSYRDRSPDGMFGRKRPPARAKSPQAAGIAKRRPGSLRAVLIDDPRRTSAHR
jgi:REP element-mobilizing transposase RayT